MTKNTSPIFILAFSTLSSLVAFSATTTTQYVYLTINIYGNGNLTVNVPGTPIYQTINKTTTFRAPAGHRVQLCSNKPFWLGNGTLVTTVFWGWLEQNTTLNVYFNVSGVTYPPSEYTKVTVVDEDKLNLTVSINSLIFNSIYFLTQFYIDNSSATFYVPINSTVFINYNKNFYVNGSLAEEYSSVLYVYQHFVNSSKPVVLVVTPTTSPSTTTISTTTTLPRTTVITLPAPNTTATITPHTGTVIPTSTSSNNQLAVYAIIAVIVIVLVAFFVLRRVRK